MLEGIEQIQTGLAALAETDPSECSGEELGDAVLALEKVKAQLCAQTARVVRGFDRSGHWCLDGSRNAAAWVARRARTNPAGSRAGVRLGRTLPDMPLTAAALAAGEITEAHAQRLGRLVRCRRTRAVFEQCERELVDKARTMGWDEFDHWLDYWENAADPDGAEDKATADHEDRRAHLSETYGGSWRLDCQFDAIGGTELATALARIYQQLYQADWAEARTRLGDNATADDLARTPAQRRADAFIEMARRAMSAPPGSRLPEPLITVLVDYKSLTGRVLELLSNGTVVTPNQIGALLTHGDIERAVYDGESRNISDLGRRTRFFRGALRRTIEINDRRCTFPGCDRPAEFCDVDHIITWADDGETNQDNGRLRCGYHNRNRGPEDPDGNPIEPGTDGTSADDIWDATIERTDAMVTTPTGSDPPGHGPPDPPLRIESGPDPSDTN